MDHWIDLSWMDGWIDDNRCVDIWKVKVNRCTVGIHNCMPTKDIFPNTSMPRKYFLVVLIIMFNCPCLQNWHQPSLVSVWSLRKETFVLNDELIPHHSCSVIVQCIRFRIPAEGN